MNKTSIPPSERLTALYRELHEKADRYFNGPYKAPDTRERIGRDLRELILRIDLRQIHETP